jgi:Zn-dependent M28 family amino/carboxypeptidase
MLELRLSPDFMPEEVIFIRSDQYSFVRQGIPSVYAFVGTDTGNPSVDGEKTLRDWMASIYHRPTDDLKQEMDFEAGADYARLEFLIGYLVANGAERPRWNEGSFLGEKFAR